MGLNPSIGSALISAGAGVAGGLIGAASGVRQNRLVSWKDSSGKTYKVARRNRDSFTMNDINNNFNAAEAEKSRLHQSKEAQIARDWDSAINVRKRYEEAGINPYLAMSGQGVADSPMAAQATASGSPVGLQAPIDPTNGMANVSNAVNTAISSVYDARNMKTLLQTNKEVLNSHTLDNEAKRMSNDITKQAMNNLIERSKLENDMLKEQIHGQQLDNYAKKLENDVLPQKITLFLQKEGQLIANAIQQNENLKTENRLLEQRIKESQSQEQLNKALAEYQEHAMKLVDAQARKTIAEAVGQEFWNKLNEEQREFLAGQIRANYGNAWNQYQIGQMEIKYRSKMHNYGFTTYGNVHDDIFGNEYFQPNGNPWLFHWAYNAPQVVETVSNGVRNLAKEGAKAKGKTPTMRGNSPSVTHRPTPSPYRYSNRTRTR